MGVNTTLYKTMALVLSAFFTAIAGGIHAYWITFIDPASAFDLTLNVRMVIMAMFGGPGTVFGPVFGALVLSAVYEVLANWISTAAALLFGWSSCCRSCSCRAALPTSSSACGARGRAISCRTSGSTGYERRTAPPLLLETRGLTKRFQGLVSVDDVSFTLPKGEILALIGPNGAGKTTLVNMISGTLAADEGELDLRGRADRRAACPIAARISASPAPSRS